MADLVASNLTLLKWAAQDWGRLVVSRFEGATKLWKVVYNSWSNKTTPPDWLAKWEKAALLKPAEFKVEWTKTASFGDVDFSTTLKGQCVMV